MRIGDTCKNCTERHIGCHQDCKAYNDAKDTYEKEKEVIKAKRDAEKAFHSFERERVVSALKKHGIKA